MLKRKFIIKASLILGTAGLVATGIYVSQAKEEPISVSTMSGALNFYESNSSDFADTVQDGQILQCFCWSYNEIMQYIPKIASQGFTAIQTSPVQVCKEQTVDDGKGNPRTAKGMWWAYYQPAAFTIDDTGDNALGTPEEFRQMVEMAHQYGVKVLVDVVANHLGNQWVADSLCERAYYYEWEIAGMDKPYSEGGYIPYTGEYWKFQNGETSTVPVIDTYYYKDTLKFHPYSIQDNDEPGNITQGNIGMMDLDTKDPVVQDAVADYLEELISYGVDGFRFDAAKHIETPYDQISSNFWPTVIGRAEAAASALGKDLYCYGEILNRQGIGRKLSWYTNCGVNITDSGMGHNIVENGGSGFSSFNYADDENYENYRTHMVTWAESHDNYMGTQDTHNKSEEIINKSYAILGARKDFATLYCARFENYETSYLGSVACLNGWSYDSVGAINKFHNYYAKANANENCYMDNGYTCVERYTGNVSSDNGIVIVGNSGNCSVGCTHLSAGTYTDAVTGNTFVVNNGKITGKVGDSGIAVIYNAAPVNGPAISASLESGSIRYDNLSVTYKFRNAAAVSITVDGKSVSSNTASTVVNVSNIDEGQTVTIVVNVFGIDGTSITKTYTYTRVYSLGFAPLYFQNSYNWSTVNAYCWNDTTGAKNQEWPGVQLNNTVLDKNGNTCYVCDFDLDQYDHVIFNNGNDQTVDILVTQSKEYTISGTLNNKYTVTESNYEAYTNPTPNPDPDPISNVITVDFENGENWSNVYAYCWNDATGAKNAQWPGEKATSLGMDTNGHNAYSYDVDLTQYDRIIFTNNAGSQTADFTLTDETTGFTLGGSRYDFASYVAPDPTPNPDPTPDPDPIPNVITVDFENGENWSNVYAYCWNSTTFENNGNWPGVKATSLGMDINGHNAYSYDVDLTQYDRIIFTNNAGSKTADLTLTEKTTGFTLGGSSYDFKMKESHEITIYFENTVNWSNVYVYLWNNQTQVTASAWPGVKATYVGNSVNGYKVYAITVDLDQYDRVIFSNGGSRQTVDLEINDSTTGFSISGGWLKYTCSSFNY